MAEKCQYELKIVAYTRNKMLLEESESELKKKSRKKREMIFLPSNQNSSTK